MNNLQCPKKLYVIMEDFTMFDVLSGLEITFQSLFVPGKDQVVVKNFTYSVILDD